MYVYKTSLLHAQSVWSESEVDQSNINHSVSVWRRVDKQQGTDFATPGIGISTLRLSIYFSDSAQVRTAHPCKFGLEALHYVYHERELARRQARRSDDVD